MTVLIFLFVFLFSFIVFLFSVGLALYGNLKVSEFLFFTSLFIFCGNIILLIL